MRTFKDYLEQKGYAPATIKDYLRRQAFFTSWLKAENLSIHQVAYQQLLQLIRYCRGEGHSRKTTNKILSVTRQYYHYLMETQQVTENPAIDVKVRSRPGRLPHDLLEWEELEPLYTGYPNNQAKDQRDQTILGLLIYQAVTIEELEKLKQENIKLTEGKIAIPGGPRSNRRILTLNPAQILELQTYLQTTRPQLLEAISKEKTQQLILSKGKLFFGIEGDIKLGNVIKNILADLRNQYPKLTATKIRESVIVHWLKSTDIRTVQYLAGHKYVSSTERYQQLDLEHLKEAIEQLHPLNRL